jgi:dihydroorotase
MSDPSLPDAAAGPATLLIEAGSLHAPHLPPGTHPLVAVRGEHLLAVGAAAARHPAARRVLLPGCLLLPGLVDLHAHPDRPHAARSRFGVDPDRYLLPAGTTAVLSQGDAGAARWPAYRERVLRHARCRVLLALNLSRRGEAAPGPAFGTPGAADVAACVATIRAADEADPSGRYAALWGIAVNTSPASCGAADPRTVLHRALAAAEATGRPLLLGLRRAPDLSPAEQLRLLRPGDVVTYCYSPGPHSLVAGNGVREEFLAARARGVLFDLGHGAASFSFAVARPAVAAGFLPDTLSTDWQRAHRGARPPHHLPRVVSKLLACGMEAPEAWERVTRGPAALLGLQGEAGALVPGAPANLVAVRWNPVAGPLRDTLGQALPGGCWEPVWVLHRGRPVRPRGPRS